MPVEGGHEDDERPVLGGHGLDDLEAVHAGELDVQEDEVRLQRADGGDGLLAVAALAEDLDVAFGRQQRGQPIACERIGVRDQGSDHGCPSGDETLDEAHAAFVSSCAEADGVRDARFWTRSVGPRLRQRCLSVS